VSDTPEQTAEKIAARGREALISRLRPAFEEAAAAHADVLKLDPEQLESMIQRAADRADGLQWRRALAGVATTEMGISLGEALGHPAVVRAHELLNAPSYEDSLAELSPGGARATADRGAVETEPEPEAETPEPEAETPEPEAETPEPEGEAPEPEAETPEPQPEAAAPEPEPEAEAPEPEAEAEPSDDGFEEDQDARLAEEATSEEEPEEDAEEAEDEPDEETEGHEDAEAELTPAGLPGTGEYDLESYGEFYDDEEALRVTVIHLGGIANLAPAEDGIELLMSHDGLDIIRGSSDVLGRLEWAQVKALEVPLPRGRRRMRRPGPTHLVIRTARGDASFEVPEVSPVELRQHLAPVIAEHLHRG
jgi:hypothetical protein